ncbi:hypothetical protein [Celeribacter litoreus]|uniref:hypothetical protein n=1 Tax=Celeribacter litoreus TaxID=2876714 RepID=UPI001CCF1F72|nr:hypothetical protein [Celeribacter litoreus]MCA0045037.1 hypothetical protein [Celeribacter litoreus]
MSLNLYLFLIEATASQALAVQKPEVRVGGRYMINCFAVESSLEKAKAPLPRYFRKIGWNSVEIKGEKQVPPTLRAISEPKLREAAETAAKRGVAFVVYTQEVKQAAEAKPDA